MVTLGYHMIIKANFVFSAFHIFYNLNIIQCETHASLTTKNCTDSLFYLIQLVEMNDLTGIKKETISDDYVFRQAKPVKRHIETC